VSKPNQIISPGTPRRADPVAAPPETVTAIAADGILQADGDAPLPWWSFTKTVIATAALRLVSQGRLDLDAPVHGRAFSLRQLLRHRAGLPDYGGLPAYHEAVAAGEPPWTPEDLLQRVRADTPIYPPGQGWLYSNVGYWFARRLIEDTTGEPLERALRHLVLDPAGVSGVALAREPEDLERTAWGNADAYHPGWVYHGLLTGPAGAAALLLYRLLAGTLLPAPLLAAMLARHPVGGPVPGRPWRSAAHGLGLMIGDGEPDGRYAGHTGSGPGSTCAVYRRVDAPGDRPWPAAAAFARAGHEAVVERRAMALAHGGRAVTPRGIGSPP
jgi:CubicO group peptidase (beta-lactamase class C family)